MTTILLLHPDRFLAQALCGLAEGVAGCKVETVSTLPEARTRLDAGSVEMLVASLDPLLGDVTELFADRLPVAKGPVALRILLLCAEDSIGDWLLTLAKNLPLNLCDPTQDAGAEFLAAVRATRDGARYWSPSLEARLERITRSAPLRGLTPRQQMVLAILGDGSDDRVAARLLNLQPTSVATIRRDLHRKLRLQHRGELIRTAALQGFVRFTANGVVRPAFALLQSLSRHPRRRTTTPPRLVA